MKIETLKKDNKKKIVIGVIAVISIVSTIILASSFAKYKLTESIPLANGEINYTVPDLNIIAIYQENEEGKYDKVDDIPTSGYEFSNKSYCATVKNGEFTKDENITINYDMSTKTINIVPLTKKTRCYLYFDKNAEPSVPASDVIAAIKNNANATTPSFSTSAVHDEGVFNMSDEMYGGTSYYFRGAVTNNYVMFSGFCWRIVRINGDGTIRIIYDGTTCHENGTSTEESIAVTGQPYNTSYNKSNYVGWTYTSGQQRTLSGTDSNAKSQTELWFNTNITGINAEKVADGKFCNDRNAGTPPSDWSGFLSTWSESGKSFTYAGLRRILQTFAPKLSCNSGDIYTLKVGIITADEVEMAGGNNANNTSYYLYNGNSYWTMTPSDWDHLSVYPSMLFVTDGGYISYYGNVKTSIGLRPVINLRSDIALTGSGTQNDPYVVS